MQYGWFVAGFPNVAFAQFYLLFLDIVFRVIYYVALKLVIQKHVSIDPKRGNPNCSSGASKHSL